MQRIGILGGTFNPLHLGHLIAAQEVLNKINLDRIVFIPSGDPPHKRKEDLASAKDRYEMVKLSIEDNKYFDISDIEIKRQGKTYTYDTLKELHKIYYGNSIHFIIGYDAFRDIDSWMNIDEVFKLANFIVVNRGQSKDELLEEAKKKEIKYNTKIDIVNIPNIEISSTNIRDRVNENKSINYLVCDRVREYIFKKGLYRVEGK